MTRVQTEIAKLEEQLRLAELGPDPDFFETILDDDAVIFSEEGKPSRAKAKIVKAHRPGQGPKFHSVKMKNMKIVDQGAVAIVTCKGEFKGPGVNVAFNFMRVWMKKNRRWQVVAASIAKAD